MVFAQRVPVGGLVDPPQAIHAGQSSLLRQLVGLEANTRMASIQGIVATAEQDGGAMRRRDRGIVGIVGTVAFRFVVRVKPAARRVAVGGRWDRAAAGGRWDGASVPALLVAVTARAFEGRANEAVRRALATAFGVPVRDVQIVSGHRSRDKLVELNPPPVNAPSRLDYLLAAGPVN